MALMASTRDYVARAASANAAPQVGTTTNEDVPAVPVSSQPERGPQNLPVVAGAGPSRIRSRRHPAGRTPSEPP